MNVLHCSIVSSLILDQIERAMVSFEKNPTTDSNHSALKKLLSINKHVAVIMALDMIFAGIDTVGSFAWF